MKIIIPEIPPSLNKYAGRKNVWEYRNDKEYWKTLVYSHCKRSKPIEKARVTITYYFKTRVRHDPDNYNGKLILDGLTHAKVIKDDSFSCIELVLKGGYDKDHPRTEIEVTEVEE